VFQSDRDGIGANTERYSMNADGSDQTRLVDYPGRDQDPDWSLNGRTIAFERDVHIAAGILEIFVMDADGSDVTPLTALPSENAHPGCGTMGRAGFEPATSGLKVDVRLLWWLGRAGQNAPLSQTSSGLLGCSGAALLTFC
jgi:dipeptidyl aminopeptidase/acylaminoacyl peptidase